MNNLVAIGLVLGFCLLLAAPYVLAWLVYRRNEKMLRAHATDATGLGITSQEVCRRLLDSDGLENVTVYQNTKKSSYYDRKRGTVLLGPRLYDQDTISAISEASVLCGRTYYITHPNWAYKISQKTLVNVLCVTLFLGVFLFLERFSLSEEAQFFIAFLIFSLLLFWCIVILRQQWLESVYGFERIKQVLSHAEFNLKLYRGFIFKPYRQLIATAITVLWSAIILMG